MAVFKCKMCGGDLAITEGVSIAECEYCGTKQTVPNVMDENLQNIFNRANTLRLKSEFDKAEKLYEKIIQSDSTQAEAYWGLILCKYGIEYVDDPATFKKVPTCHRASYDSIIADDDYKSALQYADAHQRTVYEEQAKEIDRIQKEILALAQKEETYDVFICYKETDASGARTQDSVIANDIYYQLTNEGFKVFYAAITLEGKLGSAYEPIIFAALNSAKVMLAIGTKSEYFNAVWVKNEWSRYLKIVQKDRSKLLIPCYRDMDAYELPEEFAHLQAQDMGKIGFINDVVRGIKKVISTNQPAPNVVKETIVTGAANTNIAPLLKRVFMFLEDGDWNSANEYCEKVLDINPECAEAYLGKLMAELKVKKQEALSTLAEPFDNNINFNKIVRYADDNLKNELQSYIKRINNKVEQERKDAILNEAKSYMNGELISNYEYSLNLLESISGWGNADVLIAECKKKIEEIKAKAEADRLEKERQAEIARKEAEKRAKRNKKIAAIVTPIIAAIIVFVIVLNTVIIPNSKYNDAVALMEEGNLDEAYNIFIELEDYKEASDKAADILFRKAKENIKNIKVGNYIKFGTYEQENNTSNGKEDIEWLALEIKNGKALVISKYALDCKQYNINNTDVTWETCSLRKWLNNDFINAAFSAEEKAIVPTVTVFADKNPDYSTNPGNSTQDQVFLLSITEANKYFKSDKARQCDSTDYATNNGVLELWNENYDGEVCTWWLRSPGDKQNKAAGITYYGEASVYGGMVSYIGRAVRPAMWIDLSKIK